MTERARAFQRDRVDAVARGLKVGGRPLHSGGRLILNIIPLSAFASSLHIDLELVSSHRHLFPPIHKGAWTSQFNFDGFITHSGGDVNHGYTQIFRNGILEATQSSIIREKNDYRYIPGAIIEPYIRSVLSTFIKGLSLVGVPVPLIIMLTFEGVEGVCYDPTGDMYYGSPPPLDQNTLYLPEGMVTEYGEEISYHRAVRPAIDALWNAAGQARAESFDQEGRWLSR